MILDLKTIRKNLLVEHNVIRSMHGAYSLKLNSDLEAQAQKWAEILASQNRFQLLHSKALYNGKLAGENLFGAYRSDKAPTDAAYGTTGATASWYKEIDMFNFRKPEEKLGLCGNFTQIIWRGSRLVGFGAARSSSGYVYVVGQYFPAGNVIGHVGENVKRPIHDDFYPQFAITKTVAPHASTAGLCHFAASGPIKKETKREIKEEVEDQHRIRKTIITETEQFADGSTRTTTTIETETF